MSVLRCLVTGGSSGLGRAVVQRLLSKHPDNLVASVDLVKSGNQETLDRFLDIQADVSDETAMKTAIEQISERFDKRLDVLVNCAGIARAFRIYNHAKQRVHSLKTDNLVFPLLHIVYSRINWERSPFG
ncbi:hypothetical protein ACOME3_005281 [Neoechinorhynchus agilis]